MSRPSGGKKFFEAKGQRDSDLSMDPKYLHLINCPLPAWARDNYLHGYQRQDPWRTRAHRSH